MTPDTRAPATSGQIALQLLGWWGLRWGERGVSLPRREQRLLALLALTRRQPRLQIAATLWPDSTEQHAMSSLRAAVWHTRHQVPGVLSVDDSTLALAPEISVDVCRLVDQATAVADAPDGHDVEAVLDELGGGALLPGWFDDWVLYERERVEHVRFRALHALASSRLEAGGGDDAALAARAALDIEPLHEGANLVLVRAFLTDGNTVAAVRHFHLYRRQLQRELGIRPSGQLVELVRPLLVPRQREPLRPVIPAGGTRSGRAR